MFCLLMWESREPTSKEVKSMQLASVLVAISILCIRNQLRFKPRICSQYVACPGVARTLRVHPSPRPREGVRILRVRQGVRVRE